jgi:hypothetical protein
MKRFSHRAFILPAILGAALLARAAPVSLSDQKPESIERIETGSYLIDFGKVAFGNVKLSAPENKDLKVTVHFGEAFSEGRINRNPPGTVRYNLQEATLPAGETTIVAPSADERNTKETNDRHPPAILTPEEWGVVLPFRWVEVEGWKNDDTFTLDLTLPEGMSAQVSLPAANKEQQIFRNDDKVASEFRNGRLHLAETITGKAKLDVR